MTVYGRCDRDGDGWIVFCPAFNAYTQAQSPDDVLHMMAAWIKDMIGDQSLNILVTYLDNDANVFRIELPDTPAVHMFAAKRALDYWP